MSMSIEDDFYFHFDKNIGSNAFQEGHLPDDPICPQRTSLLIGTPWWPDTLEFNSRRQRHLLP